MNILKASMELLRKFMELKRILEKYQEAGQMKISYQTQMYYGLLK